MHQQQLKDRGDRLRSMRVPPAQCEGAPIAERLLPFNGLPATVYSRLTRSRERLGLV